MAEMKQSSSLEEEKKALLKTEKRTREKQKLLSEAANNLLGNPHMIISKSPGEDDDYVRFAVRVVASKLGMDTKNIIIPDDIAAKSDNVKRIRMFAKKAGIGICLVALENGWHKRDGGTLLGYRTDSDGNESLVALLPIDSRRYRLYSSDILDGTDVDDEIAESIRPNAFVCYPGLPMRKLELSSLFSFMLKHTFKQDWRIVITLSFLCGLIPLMMPLITESIFKSIIPIRDRQALGTVTQVMLISGFATVVWGFVRSVSFMRIGVHAKMALESALWSRLLSLPMQFFARFDTGDLVNRMGGLNAIIGILGENTLSTLLGLMFSFWSLLLMFYYSSRLALIAILVWIVYLIIAYFFYRKILKNQSKMLTARNKNSAQTIQILNGLSKFRLQCAEESAYYLWSKFFGEEWKWNLKIRWQANYISLINIIQPTLLTMIIYYITMRTVQDSPIFGYAEFIGFQTALSGFNATLVTSVSVLADLFKIGPYIENLKPLVETEPEVTEDKADAGELSGALEVRNLRFKYTSDGPMVLNGISFSIKAGEFVAFVGTSGCGKSTLVRILLGFEAPTQGAVLFDGNDLATLNVVSVRSQMGVVLQNGQLMGGDIFTNIVGTSSLTLDDAWEAAHMVGLDRDIENMPMGMFTLISEGSGNISGGQKQRILIARSIVHKPKIVILDEATSALDNITQGIVAESLSKMNATRLTVAHRLSTIKDADRIFVLDKGEIAEEGNYDSLMSRNGIFAKLSKRQLILN